MSKKPDTCHLTCGGCWKNGTLEEVLPGNQIAEAWYQCKLCAWAGPTGAVKKPRREPTLDQEIRAVRREDVARGEPGSSSSGGGNNRKKPVQWVKGEGRKYWDSGEKSGSAPISGPRNKVLRWGQWTLRVTEQEWELLLKAARGRYPAGLKPLVSKALGHEPKDVTDVLSAFRTICLEFLSRTS